MRNTYLISIYLVLLPAMIPFIVTAPSAAIINVPADYPTIQQGIDASANSDTVLVQPGTYYENVNFNGHNIVLGSLFLTTGNESYIEQTIIDADSAGTVVTFENSETNAAELVGFTIQRGFSLFGAGIFCTGSSPVVRNNIIKNNEAFEQQSGDGGGVLCVYSDMILIDNVITANYASGALGGFGGGIHCSYSNPVIMRNVVTHNQSGWGGGGFYLYISNPLMSQNVVAANRSTFWGGGFYLDESSPVIFNSSLYGNVARWMEGGGIYCINNSNPVIVNSIMWADSALEGGDEIYVEDGMPSLSFTDIEGGWQGTGNIDSDPYFRDPDNGDLHIMSTDCGDQYTSPCIDAGDPMIIDSLLDCMGGLGTTLSDLGAYGGGDSVSTAITDNTGSLPDKFLLSQNYPNPFNARTSISYFIPSESHVTLEIFDLLGGKVETLVNQIESAGTHTVIWNAEDFPSGVYFYKLRAGDLSRTSRMILLK
jgi:hypothetical protein